MIKWILSVTQNGSLSVFEQPLSINTATLQARMIINEWYEATRLKIIVYSGQDEQVFETLLFQNCSTHVESWHPVETAVSLAAKNNRVNGDEENTDSECHRSRAASTSGFQSVWLTVAWPWAANCVFCMSGQHDCRDEMPDQHVSAPPTRYIAVLADKPDAPPTTTTTTWHWHKWFWCLDRSC